MDILKIKQNGVWTAIPAIIGPRGIGITSITKTGTSGLTDTYTITFSDNTTTTFTLNNGAIPNLTIGTVTEGATAAATITGTAAAPILNLVLPNANVPTRVSELENDAGYLTEHQDLSNYVQRTDYATADNAGVVKVGSDRGLNMSTAGQLTVVPAPSSFIKAGEQLYYPISPKRQHESAFYGLAKAAGDTTQSQSSNAVGTYTNEAKAAIQTMLDVPSNADVAAKQDALTFDNAPTANSTNPVTSGGIYDAIAHVNTMKIHICGQGEYDSETGVPTVANPDSQSFYLVPGGADSNLFIEWVYVNGAWERFGSADVDLSGYATKADTVLETTLSLKRKTGTTIGTNSIALGYNNEASGGCSTAIGQRTQATSIYSTSFGCGTIANIGTMMAIGMYNAPASEYPKWVAGTYYNVGDCVIAPISIGQDIFDLPRKCLIENNDTSFDGNKWGIIPAMKTGSIAFTVGNGTAPGARSNAYALDWDGNGHYMGDVYVHANADSSGGTKVATVEDIPDIQINGTSIVNNAVANIPVATSSSYGVIIPFDEGGTKIVAGKLTTNSATADNIKAGSSVFKPITPVRQDHAVFYGLSKVAGVDLANETVTLGTYPETSKTAIKAMLGVQDGLKVVRLI